MERPVYKVSQVNAYAKRLLAESPALANIRISGEISNFKHHSSGHLYFALKDELAQVSAVMFSSDAASLRFEPAEGMNVIASGSVSLYEKTGQYQFYIRKMEPDGQGALFEAFERLKAKLAEEGLFDESRKQSIPAYATKIVLVTSPTGAAVQDMIRIAKRRHPGVHLTIVPVLVQGESAAPSIVKGLRQADTLGADAVIVGRGGGSIEDLWAFNEEIVARAIAEMKTPVISAVGHETDFTIADFAADLRASTPSAAAELCVPAVEELQISVERLGETLKKRLQQATMIRHERLEHAGEELSQALRLCRQKKEEALERLRLSLRLLNPEIPLERGYAYVTAKDGAVLSQKSQFEIGRSIYLHVADGVVSAKVTEDNDE